ncbi:hypothetical protein KKH05_01215, partial [Patescibacteria group bacterium]|nr:hypothetical protein [Patescibacteria group bacterium]
MQYSDILILIGIAVVVWLLLTRDKTKEGDTQSALLLQNQMKEINRTIQKQYEESIKIVKDSVRGLTKMEESQKQVADVGKQIEGLQNILKNPKQRGVLG